MIKDKVLAALNQQVNHELTARYLYLSLVAWFESKNLKGFAQFFRVQVDEENIHATMIFDHINERGGKVTLLPLAQPRTDWDSPLDAYRDALAWERRNTQQIHDLTALASAESDLATVQRMQWFIAEQVEEEAWAMEWVGKLELADNAPGAIFMLDKEAGARPPAAPPTGA